MRFRYYTHIIRAREDDKSREIGLRKFYADEKYKKLKDEHIMQELKSLAEFWRYANVGIRPDSDDEEYIISLEAQKYLHCLNSYPNEFWKYPTTVFFIKNKDKSTFTQNFVRFLKYLTTFLFVKFIEKPTVNAIKDPIYNLCSSLYKEDLQKDAVTFSEENIKKQIENFSSSRLSQALLLLSAYLHSDQKQTVTDTFDIEHIFPKKWQDTNYNGWDQQEANEYLDKFGNKVILEKRLNIQAGNGYFGKKKEKYKESEIAVVNQLGLYQKQDWNKEDIIEREESFKEAIIDFFKENTRLI